MATLLRERGVQDEQIVLEDTASDTLSATFAVERLLRGCADVPVYAASSLYHLPRCLVLLRLMGVAARPALPPTVPAATRWWCRCYWWLRELAALPYDVVLVLLRMPRGPRSGH